MDVKWEPARGRLSSPTSGRGFNTQEDRGNPPGGRAGGRWGARPRAFQFRTPAPRMPALTDGARASARVLLQQLDDVGLLRGRAAAADHGRALAGQLHELVLVVLQADLGRQERGRRSGHGQMDGGRMDRARTQAGGRARVTEGRRAPGKPGQARLPSGDASTTFRGWLKRSLVFSTQYPQRRSLVPHLGWENKNSPKLPEVCGVPLLSWTPRESPQHEGQESEMRVLSPRGADYHQQHIRLQGTFAGAHAPREGVETQSHVLCHLKPGR